MKKIVGIINCTPDSYFDGGLGNEIERARRLLAEGADILDIGGESTRRGGFNSTFVPISEEEELRRVMPVIRALKGETLSIDTTKPKVAQMALEEGVSIINDVSGFENPEMRELAKGKRVILMHCHEEEEIIPGILRFFEKRLRELDTSEVILDPGIGYKKSLEQQYKILRELKKITTLGFPVLIGLSRKSFMQKVLHRPAAGLLAPTLALNTLALVEGVEFIRVHDVQEHRDILTILEKLQEV